VVLSNHSEEAMRSTLELMNYISHVETVESSASKKR